MNKKLFSVLILFLISYPVIASQNGSSDEKPLSKTNWIEICKRDGGEKDCGGDESTVNHYFKAYKANYLLPWSQAEPEIEDRMSLEVKFQISIQQMLLELWDFDLSIGYTQKSFWQTYDQDKSRPFRETNYNPEIFIKTPELNTLGTNWKAIIGYEHESNGENLPYSKSWDRFYSRLMVHFDGFHLDYKLWYRIPEKKKEDANDPEGDDNPDIADYYGFSEATIDIYIGEGLLSMFARLNPVEEKGAYQLDFSYPFPGKRIYWYLQYWNGYGESLIDYNRRLSRFGIGIMVTRPQIY